MIWSQPCKLVVFEVSFCVSLFEQKDEDLNCICLDGSPVFLFLSKYMNLCQFRTGQLHVF